MSTEPDRNNLVLRAKRETEQKRLEKTEYQEKSFLMIEKEKKKKHFK